MQPFNLFCVFGRSLLFASRIDRLKAGVGEVSETSAHAATVQCGTTPHKRFFVKCFFFFFNKHRVIMNQFPSTDTDVADGNAENKVR